MFLFMTKIIGIAAGKGGVGKSTTVVNIARSLQRLKFKVGIIDADIYGPSLVKMLPKSESPSENKNKIIPANCDGITYISTAFFEKNLGNCFVRAPIVNNIIEQFITNVEWGELDYLLIDFPPGTGDVQLTILQKIALDGVVIVTTPQEVSLLDVRKTLLLFQKMNVKILGVIENMSYFLDPKTHQPYFVFGVGGGESLAKETNVPLLAQVPINADISSACDKGEFLPNNHPISVVFDDVVHKISDTKSSSQELDVEYMDGNKGFTLHGLGNSMVCSAKDLQSSCRCVRCLSGKNLICDDVFIKDIIPVGCYAIEVTFSSGCSRGIYTFDHIKCIDLP